MRTTRRSSRPVRLIAALSAALLVAAACETDDPEEPVDDPEEEPVDDPEDDEAAPDAPDFLTLATGSTGGTYFPLGGAMAGVWNDNLDVQVGTQSSGASVENMRLLDADEVDLIMAVNGVAADALAGTGEFEGEEYDFSFLGNVYAEVTQVVARDDAGIDTIADMEGMRVAIGPPGSGTEVIARQMLEAEGIDPEADIEAFSESFGDAADGLRDGTIDAAFAILALPAGSIEEVATATDLSFVNIDDDLLQALLDDDPSLSEVQVEPDTYPGQDDEVTWVTNWATLYAPSDLHEDTVHDLVRVLYEEQAAIEEAHAVGAEIQLDIALEGRADIPIHPGAERYYEEAGEL